MNATPEVSEDRTVYRVVINHEEQYSIWPEGLPCPAGWTSAGPVGSKAECLAHIEEAWRDMRPASLRRAMAELAAAPAPAPAAPAAPTGGGPRLVDLLCQGEHPAELCLRPERSAAVLARAIEAGLVHVKLTGTRGGTELGVPLDRGRCEVQDADLQRGTGPIHLEGELSLDLVRVRCIVDLDLATFAGTARLLRLAPPAA